MTFRPFAWLRKPSESSYNNAVGALFSFLRSLVNREDLIEDIWKRIQSIDSLPQAQQEHELIATYLAFEQFILKNKPLIVKKEFSKSELRKAVSESVHIDDLPETFRVFFLPETQGHLLFFDLITRGMVGKIIVTTGESKLAEIVATCVKQTSLEGLKVTDKRIDSSGVGGVVTRAELISVCEGLYGRLRDQLRASVGEQSVSEVTQASYEFVQHTYGAEKMQDFFEFLPDNLLSSERVSYLSHEELARRVQEVTAEEKKKKEEAEHLAEQLAGKVKELEGQYESTEETKRAMLNLLEDARELEATLKTERDRATAIVSSMGEGLYVVDTEYRVILVNRVAEEYFGLAPGTSVGKNLSEITKIYKDDKELPPTERSLYKTIHTGESLSVTMEDNYTIQSPNGRIPVVYSTVALKKDDIIIGGLVTFHSVKKDKEIKQTIEHTVTERTHQLQQEQARFTASIRSLELGYILTDLHGVIVNKNPAADHIFGLKGGEWHLNDIEHSLASAIPLHEYHEKAQKEGKPVTIKDTLFGAKHLDIFVAPIFIDEKHSEFIGTVIVIQDITEAKVMERSREEFFSIASHELRTPLTAIRGNTSMILEYFAEELKNAELKEMIDDIHDSSIRLINIVNDFLQTSRLEQGRLQFKNEAFDIVPLIEEALKEYEVTGSRKKLYLKYEPPEKPMPQVVGDRDRIKEVLINLVGNALKFTEEGGVTVKVYLSDDYVRVVVEDTGRGIPYEYQMLLFRKFQQAGNSLFTRDTTKGTGLGLYISKLLVEGMGGTIGLQYSRPGKGSAFGFALPIVGSAHAAHLTAEKKEEKTDSVNSPVAPRV